MPAALKESSVCPGGCVSVGEPSTEGERGRPEKIPFVTVVGDGNDGVFTLRERSDGEGEGEVDTSGDGGKMAVEDWIGCDDIICCKRMESMTSISPFGSFTPFDCAGISRPARTALTHLLERRATTKLTNHTFGSVLHS